VITPGGVLQASHWVSRWDLSCDESQESFIVDGSGNG